MHANDISIVIPIYNRERSFSTTLDSISRSTIRPKEIFLVDDHSSDNTCKAVCEYMASSDLPIKLITLPVNGGPAKARNEGIMRATGDYVWLMDSDVEIPFPDFLSTMINVLKENPECGAVGGSVENVSGEWVHSRTDWEDNVLPRITQYKWDNVPFHNPRSLSTSNLLSKRDVLLNIGMFNETLSFLEDVDISIKIIQTGSNLYTDKETCIYHHQHPSGRDAGGTFSFYSSLMSYVISYHQSRLEVACSTLKMPLFKLLQKDLMFSLGILLGGKKELGLSRGSTMAGGGGNPPWAVAMAHGMALILAYLHRPFRKQSTVN